MAVVEERVKVIASEYLDNGEWGILTDDNRIVVGLSAGLTQFQAEYVAEQINALLEEKHRS